MKKILVLSLIGILICRFAEATNDLPGHVIISGKVLHFVPENRTVQLTVNRLAFRREYLYVELDSLGCFTASFESYIPVDVGIFYRTNFLVLIHPGDSLHVEFDGDTEDAADLLKTVSFSGKNARDNRDASAFQLAYYSNELYYDGDKKERAYKEYDLYKFRLYLDTIQKKSSVLTDQFLARYEPSEEVGIWAQVLIGIEYFEPLLFYPFIHQTEEQNKQVFNWAEYKDYYGLLNDRLPVTQEMLISTYALNVFINRFQNAYVIPKISSDFYSEKMNNRSPMVQNFVNPVPHMTDSIYLQGIIENVPDTLLRQMLLTDYLYNLLKSYKTDLFVKSRKTIDDYIKEPYLKIPLMQNYASTREEIDHPLIATDAILRKLRGSSAGQIIDSLLFINKGKVIYMDCWSVWCGPCRSEMPRLKKLMQDMSGKDVAFVYLCLDSDEKNWKASLDNFQIGGQHILLFKGQSAALKQSMEIFGVPYYILIDKNGTIIEKGNYLDSYNAKPKIERLLVN